MTSGVASRKHPEPLIEGVERACALLRAGGSVDRNKEAIDRAIEVLEAVLASAQTRQRQEDPERAKEIGKDELATVQLELRRRDDFLAVVAHELRNPIASLAFAADLLLTEATQNRLPSGNALLRRFEILHRQIGRLMNDLNRLLDFTRIRSGWLELRREEVDLAEVVREVLNEMKPQLDRNRCELRISCPESVRGLWDSMRVRQIIGNLISNAAKFGAGGPVEIVVAGEEKTARLSVRDHGPGIAEQERERIFERFEQAAGRGRHTGFGVGLWVVKRIVDALGGRIVLESKVGQGATFTVTLPRSENG
jgi:signal transduction histidine kinase